jgi:hypothetical protein
MATPVGIAPKLSDAGLVTLAVLQALLGFTSEARWLRYAGRHLRHLFPYLPGQSGYNKRLRRTADLLGYLIGAVARDTALWSDDLWVVDSTRWNAAAPARPPSARRWSGGPVWLLGQPLALLLGIAASACVHLPGLPVAFALTGAKADERQVLVDLLAVEPQLVAARPGQILIADKHYYGGEFERGLAGLGVRLLRPARKGEAERPGRGCSSRCGSSSSRSTRPSGAGWTWNAMVAAPVSGSPSGSSGASWPSPP